MTVSRQIGQYVLNGAQSDTFYIVWTLLRTCNYACPYCFEPKNVSCVMLRDRLLTMARHALEPMHELYDITFTGGEPSLHPCLPDIVRYISISGRKARIIIAREIYNHIVGDIDV